MGNKAAAGASGLGEMSIITITMMMILDIVVTLIVFTTIRIAIFAYCCYYLQVPL